MASKRPTAKDRDAWLKEKRILMAEIDRLKVANQQLSENISSLNNEVVASGNVIKNTETKLKEFYNSMNKLLGITQHSEYKYIHCLSDAQRLITERHNQREENISDLWKEREQAIDQANDLRDGHLKIMKAIAELEGH